jgi:hypothetical protein
MPIISRFAQIPRIAAVLLIPLAAAAGSGAELLRAQAESTPAFLWIEGETPARTTFNRHGWYSGDKVRRDLLSPGSPGGVPGDWLAHYANDGRSVESEYRIASAEDGPYTLWIRASAFTVRMWYRVDNGPRVDIDMESDRREFLKLLQPGAIDIRYLAWIKVGTLDLTAGQHRLVFGLEGHPARQGGQEVHGGIDALCLTNFPWAPTGALQPDLNPTEPGPTDWFPLIPSDDPALAGGEPGGGPGGAPASAASITDLSALLDRPAGRRGAVRRVADRLEFADGTPVKFWGVNASIGATPEVQAAQARYYAKQGINLVRLHPVQAVVGLLEVEPATGARRLDPTRLDRLDRWFAALKAQGIYMAWSPVYPHAITPADGYPAELYAELPDAGTWNLPPGTTGKSTSGYVNFMPQLQAAEWAWLQALLAHTNPYTGLRYADDPALAIIEVHNEDSVFWHYPLNALESGQDGGRPIPRHVAELQRMWMEWLRGRYADDAALLAAWGRSGQGSRPGDSLTNPRMGIYGAWEMAADGPARSKAEVRRMGDFIRFLAETQRGYFARRGQALRDAGFRGVTVATAWQAGGPAATLANLWTDDALDMIDRHRYAGGHGESGQSPHRIAAGAVRAESHLAAPGSGILGAGFEQVEDKPFMLSEWTQSPPNEWKAEIAPLFAFYGMGLNGWDASTHFHASLPRMGGGWPDDMNSYVTETPHFIGQFPALARAIHRGDIAPGDLVAARRLATGDIFRGVDAINQSTPSGGWGASGLGDLATPPEVFAMGRVTVKVGDALPRSARADWDALWDRGTGIVRSGTGELAWDSRNRIVTVASPRSQAVIGFAGGRSFDLPGLRVDVTTPFVSLIFTSLDDRPIAESAHILITALARDRQTGALYSADGTRLEEVGGPPLLLEPVQARITFKGAALLSARVVDIHGTPTDREIERAGNTITIDGRYASYYFEVRRDGGATEPTPMIQPTPTTQPTRGTPATATHAPATSAPTTSAPRGRVFLPVGWRG